MTKVLVACEESQRVCTSFRKRGHEAYSCDIISCSGDHPEWHIMQDVLPLINGKCEFETTDGIKHKIDGKWDMIIAHPPCTYLSNAGACRLYPQKGILNQTRYEKGLKAKEFFLKFLSADCERICVENPVHCKVFNTPRHTQEIQPYMFGEPYTKKTRLWLKGLPPLRPTNIITENIQPFLPSGTGRKIREKYGAAKRGNDARERSKTFWGIAEAMAEQWGAEE